MVLRVQTMRALVPATASTSARVAVATPERWPSEIQRHALGRQDGAGGPLMVASTAPASTVAAIRHGRRRMSGTDRPAGRRSRRRSVRRSCRACAPPAARSRLLSAGMVSSLVMSPARPRSSSSAARTMGSTSSAWRRAGEGQGDRRHAARAAQRRALAAMRSASAKVMKVRAPFASRLREIAAPMAAADFVPRQRARRHQLAPRPVMLSSAGSPPPARSSRAMTASASRQALGVALQADMAAHGVAQHMRRRGRGEALAARAACRAPALACTLALHVLGDARAEHQAFQQRIGGQPVGAMQARWRRIRPTTHRPGSEERPCASDGDAAHVIMRGRRHRDRLRRRIDAGRHAGGIDGREMLRRNPRRWPRGNRGRRLCPAAIWRWMARATTSRGASSASGCDRGHEALARSRRPGSRLRRAALRSPAARDRGRWRWRWDGTARIPDRRSARRRAPPCPGLRRALPADWW